MLNYNAPVDGVQSSIDGTDSTQMNTFVYLRGAIIEARKEAYFSQMATAIDLPKHMGKTVKLYEYIPLLDDRNVNDQGIDANGAVIVNGNLYGSSHDIGTITAKLPTLTENGGRVNRVGFKRIMREGSLHKFGFFTEFTKESIDFDSDPELMKHLSRLLLDGAYEITEAVLQKDILAAAATVVYAGAADSDDEITGEVTPAAGGAPEIPASIVSYENLARLEKILNDNRTPKNTKVISGSRNTDTRVINAARYAYISSDVTPLIRAMVDSFERPAFIPIAQYADATNIASGEIGSVGGFRFIEVPESLYWAGAGAEVVNNPGYRSTTVGGDEFYDVFPILVVGAESFATIGFQTDGKSFKFDILTKMPGRETADRNDPFGETGFSSIKWYYGFLAKRPERIAIIKTVAPI